MTDTAEEPVTVDAADPDAVADTRFRIMLVAGVTFDIPSPTPLMELRESENPYRTLLIPIALPEAQALGQVIHALPSLRPGTHELFSEALFRSGTEIVAVRITRFENGVYHAELDLLGPKGRHVLDCRASDGAILALRQAVSAPILCDEDVLEAQSVR